MATFDDLAFDWSTLCQECPECWSDSDLQLAAELGKTLLERNKELETALRQHQNVIEDQTQEIEYLTKQTAALREVNDSRLRIYEQLEVSIQDLERTNHRLALDHSADKKHIKNLTATIETLESKCDDFTKSNEDLTSQLDIYRRKTEKLSDSMRREIQEERTPDAVECTPVRPARPLDAILTPPCTPDDVKKHEEMLRLSDDIRENRLMLAQEQRRTSELEEQLASMVQENNRLQDQARNWHRNQDEPKSMHEEFSILEEVRQGQVCVRCLRTTSDRGQDEMSSMMDAEEDDDRSGISSLLIPCTGNGLQEAQDSRPHKLIEIKSEKERLLSVTSSVDNPYRELVEKYEALLEVQRSQVNNLRKNRAQPIAPQNVSAPLSLQEELQISGDFSQFSHKDTDEESGKGGSTKTAGKDGKPATASETTGRKNFTRTPDLSEAETSSSGFSDETSNKATQTEIDRPGAFLCTIADGEECKFSIYDDGGSSIDSRFRNRPEYRELFKEIFTILKKAAENKDEGEKLPLLDDSAPGKVPPATPAIEEPPGNFTDDTRSVLSSAMSERSIAISDITPPESDEMKSSKSQDANNKENRPRGEARAQDEEAQRVLTPLKRQPLDYFAGSPHLKKKTSKHRNRKQSQERQATEPPLLTPPKASPSKSSGRRRRDFRPLDSSPLTKAPQDNKDWNGSSMQFYNRSVNSPTPSSSGKSGKVYQGYNPETNTWDVKQSTASQEIHKLKRLELSYAEVLRNADKNKTRRRRHQ